MKVHVYASYKRSPVGFQLGSFSFVNNQIGNYILKYCQESKLIYDLFEQNYIVQASGRLPQSNNYIFLVKDLEYTYTDHDDFGKIVYINIAFEFTDPDDYSRFVSGYYSLDESFLVKRMADFVLPNTDNKEYGLVIDGEGFNSFIKKISEKPISHMPDIEHLELVTKASSRTSFDDKVYDIFKLNFEREGNKYFYPPKKKYRTKTNKIHHMDDQSSTKSKTKSTGIFDIFIKIIRYIVVDIFIKKRVYIVAAAGIALFGIFKVIMPFMKR